MTGASLSPREIIVREIEAGFERCCNSCPYTWQDLLRLTDLSSGCICPRFSDLAPGTIIADLTCPVHGVNGTNPGDVIPDDSG